MKFRCVENGNMVFFEVSGEPCFGLPDINGQDIYAGDTLKAYPKGFTGDFNRDGYHLIVKCIFIEQGGFFRFECQPVSEHSGRCVDGFTHAFEVVDND